MDSPPLAVCTAVVCSRNMRKTKNKKLIVLAESLRNVEYP